MNLIAWLAVVLLVLWIVLRVALAITSGVLHLLWIGAIVMSVFWLISVVRANGSI